MRRIFVCSPCHDLDPDRRAENAALARSACRELALDGESPLAAYLLFLRSLSKDKAEREIVLQCALAWLEVADEVLVVGDVTHDVRQLIEAATEEGLTVRFWEGPR